MTIPCIYFIYHMLKICSHNVGWYLCRTKRNNSFCLVRTTKRLLRKGPPYRSGTGGRGNRIFHYTLCTAHFVRRHLPTWQLTILPLVWVSFFYDVTCTRNSARYISIGYFEWRHPINKSSRRKYGQPEKNIINPVSGKTYDDTLLMWFYHSKAIANAKCACYISQRFTGPYQNGSWSLPTRMFSSMLRCLFVCLSTCCYKHCRKSDQQIFLKY